MAGRRPPDAQALFDAISSPVRREILWLVRAEELSVGEIGEHFELSGPTLSSHLAALRAADLVVRRNDGNFRRYRCNPDALDALLPVLASRDSRWRPADDLPERGLASASAGLSVTVHVDTPVAPGDAFEAFADSRRYSEWLGVPVEIANGRFRATLEWGTHVRGTYDVVVPPVLIAMRWDFDDDQVPLPGRELVAYLRVHPTASGSRVEVHQLASDRAQATFLADAWSMVLGRFAEAHAGGRPERRRRAARPKHGRST